MTEQKRRHYSVKWINDINKIQQMMQHLTAPPKMMEFFKQQEKIMNAFGNPEIRQAFEQWEKIARLYAGFNPMRQLLDTVNAIGNAFHQFRIVDPRIEKALNRVIVDTKQLKPLLGSSSIDFKLLEKNTQRITKDIEELLIRLSHRIKELEKENVELRREIELIERKEKRKKRDYVT